MLLYKDHVSEMKLMNVGYVCMLILQDILKYTDRAGQDCSELQKALRVMQVVPKAANDMMNVGRLSGFDVCHSLTIN